MEFSDGTKKTSNIMIYVYIYIVDRAYKPTDLNDPTKRTAHRLCQVRIEVLLAKRRVFFMGNWRIKDGISIGI